MSTTLRVVNATFTLLTILLALVAVYHWALWAFVWPFTAALSEALTWTVLALAAFVPVLVIERRQSGG